MHLYELALDEGETSRDLMGRARELGLGHLTATTVVTPEQIAALCPARAQRGATMTAPPTAPAPAAPAPSEPPPVGRRTLPLLDPSVLDAPMDHDPTGRRRPRPVLVVVGVLVALLAVAGGAVTFLGTSDGADGATTTEPVVDDGEAAEVTDPPAATGPVAGTALGKPARIVAVDDLCGGWPHVAAYVTDHAVELAAATTPDEVVRWAEEAHRAATAGMDRVIGAFGVEGPSDEAVAVKAWILGSHDRAGAGELDALRLSAAGAAGPVMVMQAAFDEAC